MNENQNEIETPIEGISLSEAAIYQKKIAACSISVGVRILENMIGDTLSNVDLGVSNLTDLTTTAIISELNL